MFQFWGRATNKPDFAKFMKSEHQRLKKLDLYHLQFAQDQAQIDKSLDLDHVFEQLDAMTTGMGITCVFNPSRLNKSTVYAIIDDALLQLR